MGQVTPIANLRNRLTQADFLTTTRHRLPSNLPTMTICLEPPKRAKLSAMGARSGSNYLTSLKRLGAEIWLGGERVGEVTGHSAFRNCARSMASLYDMQMERPEQMTYRTDDGGRSGLSFIQPKSLEELRKRTRMTTAWANFSGGMLRDTPDYANATIAAMAAARDFFSASDPRFGDNIANYYLDARKHDWCTAVALPHSSAVDLLDETSEGVIVTRWMRAPLAPFAEELFVLPPLGLNSDASSQPLAIAFAIPSNTKGVTLAHQNVEVPRSRFDAPLASRFTQIDCTIRFDHVMVPWSRVFLYGDIARCNAMLEETNASVHMMHQVAIKNLAQAEFMLGLAGRIAEVTDALSSPEIRDRIAEIFAAIDTMRWSLRTAETDAAADQWGIFAPSRVPLETAHNLFAKLHPQMVEAIRLLTSSHPIAMLSEHDFAGGDDAMREKAALYRLADDALKSADASRQVSSSDPAMTAAPSLDAPKLQPFTARINDFLARKD